MANYELNDMQKRIVNHTEGAVMVLAGAGSGKTSVLTHRIANIINKKFAYAGQILAITFTNKAAGEMRDRLAKMCDSSQYIWAQTFHSFCAKFLRFEIASLEGYNRNFSIYDENDKKMVIKSILKSQNIKDDKIVGELMNDISAYKNANMSLEEFANINMYRPHFEQNYQLMQEYENVMKKNNALDFDDLLIKTLYLLKTNDGIREKYQTNFKYILVDEFQDTNEVQYELVKLLAQKHGNIFAVGDEDQSIYSWRGANVQNIKRFLTDFSGATLYKLEQNYRSTKNIIACANKVIKHNQKRIDKTLFTENEEGIKVQYINKYSDREEAEYIAQEIYNLTHNSFYEYKDIAILMRLNALTRSVEDKCLSYNIPYKVFGGLKFYDRAEIKNIMAYLRLLTNPKDTESFVRIVNFPKRNIGDASIEKILYLSTMQTPMELLNSITNEELQTDKTLTKFVGFKTTMQDFYEKSKELKVSELVKYIIKELDLENVYATGKDEDENRIHNLDELVASIKQFEEENENASLEDYLQNVSLISDIDTYSNADNTVTLATVHSAKGLEFRVVFVIGLEENYFPIIRDDFTEDDMEEERRLMYVAVTRAKERLYLTNSSNRYMYGSSRFTLPSRFLEEMGFVKNRKERDEQRTYSYSSSYSYDDDNYYKPQYSSYSSQKPIFNSSFGSKIGSVSSKPTSTIKTNEYTDYHIGDIVSHAKFGNGKVIDYQKTGDILIINFEGIGNKILSAKYASLTLVSREK